MSRSFLEKQKEMQELEEKKAEIKIHKKRESKALTKMQKKRMGV